MWVYLPIKDYSAMQWPAPSGYHVPLTTEWQWLKTIMDWLSLTTWNSWRINLHMPFAGYRRASNSGIVDVGSSGRYWSSSPYGSDYPKLVGACILGSFVTANSRSDRALGYSIRCFKNSFIVPTSSWTVINGTLWGAWIFRNQTEWIISITSDWNTWYTIQDKNLWATTVYNDGDTLSETNCGTYFQWGNNYWFAFTWSVTTSSTQVDASNYWPWNYYSSSTFITRISSPYDWSSVQNDNLWWWVTWVKPMSELKNAYIGEVGIPSYTPTTNTVAYYPLKYDFKDYSWNGNNMVWYNSPQIAKANWVRCLDLSTNSDTWTNNKYLSTTVWTLPQGNSARTEICWVYYNGLWYGATWHYWRLANYQSDMMGWNLSPISWGSYGYNVDSNVNAQTWRWYMLAVTASSSSQILYINGQSSWSRSYPINTNWTTLYLWVTMDTWHPWQSLYLSEVIFENRVRTATEISDYYNSHKGLYWL